jgi:hypothetical protein
MFQAKMIEDSISQDGVRLSTLQLCYPRFIHAEAKTHRVVKNSGEEYVVLTQDAGFMSDASLSRNASSSRAIPVAKMIEQVRTNPAMPIHWGANQPGMQARAELTGADLMTTKQAWRDSAFRAAADAEIMLNAGAHKQVANRILEPFQWMHVIVTATEWTNFFELRDNDDAEPNIRALAQAMKASMDASTPVERGTDPDDEASWHLPYVIAKERADWPSPRLLAKLSAARCARVSYLNHDGSAPNPEKDMALYDMLVGGKPLHASPVEHQAYPMDYEHPDVPLSLFSGNFRGWFQHRKLVEAEIESQPATT